MKKNGYIEISGARVHNLKNISLKIPRNKLVVITGLSGSGKSSLAFNTIYAEGQRRYVESLSSYARQFLGRLDKPDVDFIKGIPPAIAIEQKVNTRNPRSTVGTSTEIYDYLKLLYARIGKTYSPLSGKEVKKHMVSDVVDYILSYPEGKKIIIFIPIKSDTHKEITHLLDDLIHQGINRIEIENKIIKTEDALKYPEGVKGKKINLIIDRIVVTNTEDAINRYSDSVQQAFQMGNNECYLKILEENDTFIVKSFSNRFEKDGMLFEEPTEHMFSYNNPVGACPLCEGYGKIIGIDKDLVIPDKTLSIYDNAIVCWKGEKMQKWKQRLVMNASLFDFPIHKPYYSLSADQQELLWTGNKYFRGLNAFFRYLEKKKYKIQYRVMLSKYRGKTTCPECNGRRLKKEAGYVKICGKTIQELVDMSIDNLYEFFQHLGLDKHDTKIAKRLLTEINNRLMYLRDVGLNYLTLNRLSNTLSGGESQRINLATTLGSSLTGSLYILDEPSIGLHPRDTRRLIRVLNNLRNIGNSVIVVEHEEEIIKAADEIIDLGPYAGRLGGELIYQGAIKNMNHNSEGLTARYLYEIEQIEVPKQRRKWNNYISIEGAREHNLKNIDVKIPLNVFTVITGVSGSGKSSLIKDIFYPALMKNLNNYTDKPGDHNGLSGDITEIEASEFVNQNPIGKSSRSNPVTYIKTYDDIRKLYASQQLSHINGYKPSHFSFNVDGGRCPECQGEGEITIEMQFMADVHLVCDSCNGRRFKDEILEVRYQGKNIYELLEMTVEEAIEFFHPKNQQSTEKKIIKKLQTLADVGLGYVKLGQSSSTLSGGESQRVKLASFIGHEKSNTPTLFLFDEPTTGLHFHDINKLLKAFDALIKKGHTIVVIEHNMDVIKCADWVIDLGPEGGENGGFLVAEGTPETVVNEKKSYTGKFLKAKIS